MRTLGIFVVFFAITVAMKLEEPRPNLMGTGGLEGLQLPPQFLASLSEKPSIQLPPEFFASLPERTSSRTPSLRSRSGTESCYFPVILARKDHQLYLSNMIRNLFLQEKLLVLQIIGK